MISSDRLKNVMGNYFRNLVQAPKIAWCTSVGPAELLRSFGFEVYFPENHGALLGATRKAIDYIPEAIKCGYSGHICSYTTSDIGAFLANDSPLTTHYGIKGVPKPDLIIYNTNQCREVEDWFMFFARQFNCPIAGIKPPRYIDEITPAQIAYVTEEFKRIIPLCEKVSGRKFDMDQFREVVKLSKEATLLWQKVLLTSSNTPAPFSFFDGTIHMGPIVVLRGTQAAKDYYAYLLEELMMHVKNKKGILEKETCRIFWDGMPIWGKLKMLSDLFVQNHSAVVASTYCSSWIFDQFDETQPFESTARSYTEIFINRSEDEKQKMLRHWVQQYHIDAMIFHDSKTCFNNSNARFGMPLRIKEELGIPVMVIEGDLCDLRFFSEGQTVTKVETFIEQVVQRKKISYAKA